MYSGFRFGHLTVIGPQLRRRGRGERSFRLCVCDCGLEVEVREDRLKSGRRVTCGEVCRYSLDTPPGRFWHLWRSEFDSWSCMLLRCYEPKVKSYGNYGGRGITVCDRWRGSFLNFLSDMGPKPESSCTIDRIDNDGDYEPGNCRWATRSQQARNMRNSVYVDHGGRRVLLCELCEQLGLSMHLVYGRLNLGWPLDEALSRPARQYHRRSL